MPGIRHTGAAGINRIGLSTSGGTMAGSIVPSADNTHNLGSAAVRWAAVYGAILRAGTSGGTFMSDDLVSSASGNAMSLRGNLAAAAAGADIELRAVNTRSNGKIVSIKDNNGATERAYFTFDGRLGFIAANKQTTVGAAGGASALPATPTGYFKVDDNGTTRVVPFYAAS